MSRIDELRRRLQQDPASIAFAQLAEEHRRAGDHAEAIRVCREGLVRHPAYASARVTLARALTATGDLDAAEAEFLAARRAAPDNLAAVRGLADIHQRRGHLNEAFAAYRDALALARTDPDLQAKVTELAGTLGMQLPDAPQPVRVARVPQPPAPGVVPPPAPAAVPAPAPTPPSAPGPETKTSPADTNAIRDLGVEELKKLDMSEEHARQTLAVLERWLDAVLKDRERGR